MTILKKIVPWVIRAFVMVLTLLVLILTMAATLVTDDHIREFFVARIEAAGGSGVIGDLSLGPGLRLRAADIRISDKNGTNITVTSLDLAIDTEALLYGELVINHLRMEQPNINIRPAPPKARENGNSSEPQSQNTISSTNEKIFIPYLRAIRIEELSVSNMSGSFRQPGGEIVFGGMSLYLSGGTTIEGTDVSAAFRTSPEAQLHIRQGELLLDTTPHIQLSATLNKDFSYTIAGVVELAASHIDGPSITAMAKKLSADIDAEGSVAPIITGKIRSTLRLDDEPLMQLLADAEQSQNQIRYHATIANLRADLAQLVSVAGLKGVTVDGALNLVALRVEGVVSDTIFSHTASGRGEIDIKSFDSPWGRAPEGASMMVALRDLSYGSTGTTGGLLIDLATPVLAGEAGAARGVTARIEVVGGDNSKISKLDGFLTADKIKAAGRSLSDISAKFSAKGAPDTGDISAFNITLATGDDVAINIEGTGKNFVTTEINTKISASAKIPFVLQMGNVDTSLGTITAGTVDLTANITGSLGEHYNNPDILVKTDIRAEDLSGESGDVKISLLPTSVAVTAQTKFLHNWNPADMVADIAIRSGGVVAQDKIAIAPVNIDMRVSAKNFDEQIDIADSIIESEEIGAVEFGGSYKNHGQSDLHLTANGLNLAPVADIFLLLNKNYRVEQLAGKMSVDLDMQASFDEMKSVMARQKFPGKFVANISTAGLSFQLPDIGLSVAGADSETTLTADGDKAWLSINGELGKLVPGDQYDKTPLQPAYNCDVSLRAKSLRVDYCIVVAPTIGLTNSFSADFANFSFGTPGEILSQLDFDIENVLLLDPGSEGKTFGTVSVTGSGEIETFLQLNRGGQFRAKGSIEFADLSLSDSGREVLSKLTGKLPFEKTLSLVSPDKQPPPRVVLPPDGVAASVRETSFFDDVRASNNRQLGFNLKSLVAGPIELSNGEFDLSFAEDRLAVDYLRTRLLNGNLAGSFQVKAEQESYNLRSSLIFAGLDLQKLVTKELDLKKGEAEIDGSAGLSIAFNRDAEERAERTGLDISDIDMSLSLTRIGGKALRKLLNFIDPGGASPAMASARMALRYATPVKVELLARRGSLSVTLHLKYNLLLGGQTVTMPVVKRAPISGLVQFEAIRSFLRDAAFINQTMRAIGATELVIGDDGSLTLR